MKSERATGAWRTSTYSGTQGGNCVEVAPLSIVVGVRDSKLAASPIVHSSARAWAVFLDAQR